MNDDTKDSKVSDLEWQNRVLCSDESCIGTIDENGRCRECGKPYEGELPAAEDTSPEHATSGAALPAQSLNTAAALQDDEPEEESDPDWDNRTLCADESCIGVIGPDGRCKECGRPLG